MDQDLSFFHTGDDFCEESVPLLAISVQTSPKQIIPALRVGHRILINDWEDEFTVYGVSENFVVAFQPTSGEYTIIPKKPTPFSYNGIRKGSYVRWIFGWRDGYDFHNPSWVEKYLASLESGETWISTRNRKRINRISVVADSLTQPLEIKISDWEKNKR